MNNPAFFMENRSCPAGASSAILRLRRLRPLQPMAAVSRSQNPRQQVSAGPVCPCRQRRQEFFGEFRKTEEISRFSLWRLVSCPIPWQQAGAGTACQQSARELAPSQTSATPIYGGRQSPPEPAAASGTGHCLPFPASHARTTPLQGDHALLAVVFRERSGEAPFSKRRPPQRSQRSFRPSRCPPAGRRRTRPGRRRRAGRWAGS